MFKRRMFKPYMFKPKPSRRAATLVLAMCAILLGATLAAYPESSGEEQFPAGPGKEKAEVACGSCHEARIIVQQRLSKAAWAKEVDKMVTWGADVDPKDRDTLVDYLSGHFTSDQPAYEAPKSAAEKRAKPKGKP